LVIRWCLSYSCWTLTFDCSPCIFLAVSPSYTTPPLHVLPHGQFPSAASTRNDKGKIPLMYAAREGRLGLVRLFLERNPESAALASHKNKLALHFAAGDGHYEVCRLLLQVHPEGASVVTQKGKIAMHLAARWGYVDLCRLFCEVSPKGVL
jgi:ankyrin repeat protein